MDRVVITLEAVFIAVLMVPVSMGTVVSAASMVSLRAVVAVVGCALTAFPAACVPAGAC